MTGHADPDVQELLPAIVSPDRVASVGPHSWAEDDIANVARWGIRSFIPDEKHPAVNSYLEHLRALASA